MVRSQTLLVVVAMAVPCGSAAAATKNGITPLSPKPGASVPKGKSPTFRMRVRGLGNVWVHVCRSPERNESDGTICGQVSLGRARKRGGEFRYKPRFFDYPGFWLNRPGTYYWQAHRVRCGNDVSDCRQEGPVVRFRVR